MELGRELFECPLHPLGALLSEGLGGDWYWVETERGAAIMDLEEAEGEATDVGSHPLLSASWDDSAVAVGDGPEERLTIEQQMADLADLLREFAGNAERHASEESDEWQRRKLVDANKYLLRCVDNINRFTNEYR